MANPITWRNVEAPDFRSSMAGISEFGRLFGNATGGLAGALDGFQKDQMASADREVAARALAIQNPQAFQSALADGSLIGGAAPSVEQLRSLQTGVGTRMTNVGTDLGNQKDQYTFDRVKDANSALDGARPLVNEYLAAAASGDAGRIGRAREGLLSTGLNPGQVQGLIKDAQGNESTSMGNTDTRFTLGNKMADDALNRQADGMVAELQRNYPDRVSLKLGLDKMGVSGPLRDTIERKLSGAYGGALYGPSAVAADATSVSGGAVAPVGSAGAGTRQGNPYDSVLGFGAFGTPSKPFTSMTGSEAIEFGKNTLIPATRNNGQLGLAGTGKGSSAMGAFQFTGETLQQYMPKVLKDQGGLNAQLTPENQDKLAEAIFNDRKSGNLKDTWSSLPSGTAGAYKDKTWAEMKPLIAAGEVGNDLSSMRSQIRANQEATNASQLSLADRAMNDRRAGVATDIADTIGSTADTRSVVDKELGDGGAFKGTARNFLLNKVTSLMQEGGMNAATAMAILKRNTVGADAGPRGGMWGDWSLDKLGRQVNMVMGKGATPNLGNGQRLNDDGVQADMLAVKSGKPLLEVLANDSLDTQAKGIQTAQAKYEAAQGALAQMQLAAAANPRLQAQLPGLIAQRDVASQALKDARSAQANNPNFNPNRGTGLTPAEQKRLDDLLAKRGQPDRKAERISALASTIPR